MPIMTRTILIATMLGAATLAACAPATPSPVQRTAAERGRYLVTVASCNDCHTPGYFLGQTDTQHALSGSDVGFATPSGVFVGPNLTPDIETGLGSWTKADIVRALKTGVRPEGRILSTVMPWQAFAHFDPKDLEAIAIYLKTLPPVRHMTPGPLPPGSRATFTLQLTPPEHGRGAGATSPAP